MRLLRDIGLALKLLLTGLLVVLVGICVSLVIGIIEAGKMLAGFACFIASCVADDWKGRR